MICNEYWFFIIKLFLIVNGRIIFNYYKDKIYQKKKIKKNKTKKNKKKKN